MLCYAKSLQSCLWTLCDPIEGSPSGSAIPGILQARIQKWVAISFSNAWKWKVKVKSWQRMRWFGWHHWLNGHEFEQAPGVGDGQKSLACCSPWSHKESDMTEWLNLMKQYFYFYFSYTTSSPPQITPLNFFRKMKKINQKGGIEIRFFFPQAHHIFLPHPFTSLTDIPLSSKKNNYSRN